VPVSARKIPILLRRGPLSGTVFALTRYKRIGDLIDVHAKENVDDDFRMLAIEPVEEALELAGVEPGRQRDEIVAHVLGLKVREKCL
jgi:hypothetical protein